MRLQVVCRKALESELNPRQRGHSFSLVPTLVLVPTKVEEDKVLTLLTEVVILHMGLLIVEIGEPSRQLAVLMACGFRMTALTLKEQIYAELHDLRQILLGVFDRSGGRT